MKHRYGRHGDKAWLRWRKKHFGRTSLTLAPQLAVLHVPLEFLSRIRKVTILMADGTELAVEVTATDALPSPTVDADTEKLGVVMLEQIPSPLEGFFTAAKDHAKDEAERVFRNAADPYSKEPDEEEAKKFAKSLYYPLQLVRHLDRNEAQKQFLLQFRTEYKRCLDVLIAKCGGDTEETFKLFVFARKDKIKDDSAGLQYVDDRALVRAYISLFSNDPLCQESVDEKVLVDLRERAKLYQKFYNEFEPAKEGH